MFEALLHLQRMTIPIKKRKRRTYHLSGMILERNVQLRQTNRPDYATNTSEFVRTLCAVTLMPPFKQTNIKLTNHLINDRLISKTTEV